MPREGDVWAGYVGLEPFHVRKTMSGRQIRLDLHVPPSMSSRLKAVVLDLHTKGGVTATRLTKSASRDMSNIALVVVGRLAVGSIPDLFSSLLMKFSLAVLSQHVVRRSATIRTLLQHFSPQEKDNFTALSSCPINSLHPHPSCSFVRRSTPTSSNTVWCRFLPKNKDAK